MYSQANALGVAVYVWEQFVTPGVKPGVGTVKVRLEHESPGMNAFSIAVPYPGAF